MEDGEWWEGEKRSLQGWGGKGESLVEHYRVIKKWIGFLFEVFFMFICFFLRELLPLELLCSIYCIARSQQRHKSSDSNAEDVLIGWHTPELKPAFCNQRDVTPFRMETLTCSRSSPGEELRHNKKKDTNKKRSYFNSSTNEVGNPWGIFIKTEGSWVGIGHQTTFSRQIPQSRALMETQRGARLQVTSDSPQL